MVLIKSEVQMSCYYIIRPSAWNSVPPSLAATHLLPVIITLRAEHV